jgi:L-aspartate oxidase
MPAEAQIEADLVVVGAGVAGLFAAITGAQAGARVALVSAVPLAETASYWAQGGIAAALAPDDSVEAHIEDTLRAGRGIGRESAVRMLCVEAPARVADLQRLGVRFDLDAEGRLALGLEGGHRHRRIIHAGGSATGRRVARALAADAATAARVTVVEGSPATGLLVADGRCVGVVCADGRRVRARGTVLATGGAAALWARTTNPPGSVGGGLLAARAAGARLADLEFMQFHPTAVVAPPRTVNGFLISEAVRGEGAILVDADGERFVDELAPRDEVARAIQARLRASGEKAVWLDMRSVDPGRFPNIVEALRGAGMDPAKERIPVAPAAHYTMGGIATDLDGRSTVPGLYAVGECSCTGLHGANRIASNSLSECLVFGHRAALAALDELPPGDGEAQVAAADADRPTRATRHALWDHAGLARDARGLAILLEDPHPLARLIGRSALAREESRGAHYRTDHPEPDPAKDLTHTVLEPDGTIRFERWT